MKSEPAEEKPIPSISASSSTKTAGVGSCPKSTGASKKLPFLWKDCASLTERDRVDIKQQAVLDGLRLGERLSSILRDGVDRKNQGLGAEELVDWAEQFDIVKELHEAPHSTVGLIGAVGSGKSTLLNALLGERDLLPPSNDRAGTAAACRVVYDHGSGGYRAKVLFRSRQSFTNELDNLFQNLKAKRELQAMMEDPDLTEEQEIEDQLEEIESSTYGTLQTLESLLGIKEGDLGATSTEDFLGSHPLVVLGTTVEITETDREAFVNKTKPFMTSYPGVCDGEERILWPLIESVTIFVKSDVLKYGLELVDLPGLNDAVESRSRVAEQFAKELDITVVVAPAIRATEEKTAIGFIKRRQEDDMRMNGQFAQDSLCVVISKSEDMDPNGYLGQRWIAKEYPNLKEDLDRAKILDKAMRKAESGPGLSETETYKDGEVETNWRELSLLRESLKQAAVSIRNRNISERIRKDFRGRGLSTQSVKDDQVYEDTVEVFPTSARAFQGIRHPGCAREMGFPTERHTGIPRVMQWLFEVTFKKREKHLDAILNQLSVLFARIQTWISMNKVAADMPINGLHQLGSIHQRHRRSLTAFLRQIGEELRRIEPLKTREVALAWCQKEYPRMIDRWRYRYPDQTNTWLKLFANIQGCILRKNGNYHKSKGKFSYEYQWIDNLAAIFIDKIIDNWKHAFQTVVPSYETKIQESLEHVWQRYMIALNSFCAEQNATHLQSTGKVQEAIEHAEAKLGLDAHATLTDLIAGAHKVHPVFREEIQNIMVPVFQQALAIKGAGCMRKRDEILQQFATDHSADMPVKACEAMERALAKLIRQQVTELEGLAVGAVSTVERQMKLLLGITNASLSDAARKDQKMLAAEIGPHLKSWKLCWRKPSSQREDHVMRGDLSIPDPELIKVKDDEDADQAAVKVVETDHDARLMDRL